MAKFKVTISDPQTGKASVVELEGAKAKPLLGRNVGDVLEGAPIGFQGKKLRITGGSDKDGVPLRPDVHGGGKKYLILSKGVGFRAKGCSRERRLVRGRMITDETYQVNLAIVKPEVGDAAGSANSKK
ncbi:MAG: S6e family ribosomal protein [Candidatus Bathyarchaeia archaeon]